MQAQHAATVKTLAGLHMPRMIYGTAWKKERTAELVEQAVLAGFRGIDTACQPKHYREDLVGVALLKLQQAHSIPRSELFIQTKFTPIAGQDRSQPLPYDPAAPLPEQVRQSFATSQRNLHTQHIDSLVLHSPLPSHSQSMEVWRAFEELADAGQVGQLGISNIYDLQALQAIFEQARVKPAVVQNRFHATTGYDAGIRAWCRKQGVTYQSFWTLTANPDALKSAAVRAAAKQRGCEPEQVWYRFVIQLGCVPLNGTSSSRHAAADLDVLGWEGDKALSQQEMASIGRLIGEKL